MPAPDYLLTAPGLDGALRREGPGGAFERAVLYAEDAAGALAGPVDALAYGDGAAFARGDRALFEARDADGGGRRVRFERPEARLLVTDPSGRRVAEAWARAGTRVCAVLVGASTADHVVWDVPVRLLDLAAEAGGMQGTLVALTLPGAGADDPHAEGGTVRRSPDLLAGVVDGLLLGGYTEDSDSVLAGLARGWTRSVDATASVAGGEQRLTPDAPGSGTSTTYLEHRRTLPLPGLPVAAEVVVAGPDGAALAAAELGDVEVEVAALDRAGAFLERSRWPVFGDVPEVAAPGLVLPAGTWTFRLRVLVTARAGEAVPVVAVASARLLTLAPRSGAPGALPYGLRRGPDGELYAYDPSTYTVGPQSQRLSVPPDAVVSREPRRVTVRTD